MLEFQPDYTSIYKEIENNIAESLSNVQSIKLKSEIGMGHLKELQNSLDKVRNQFKKEISFLEKNSEWEKFTIAFFGETNAGKSTILEALRILLKENKRQQKIKDNSITPDELSESFKEEVQVLLNNIEMFPNEQLEGIKVLASEIYDLKVFFESEFLQLQKEYDNLNDEAQNKQRLCERLEKKIMYYKIALISFGVLSLSVLIQYLMI